jgi:hypothetical protein
VTKAKLEPKTNVLSVTLEAFFRKADLDIGIHTDNKKTLSFVVLRGPTTGFSWSLSLAEVGPKTCEISLEGTYRYDHYPMPHWFLEMGMETIFKRMAEQLRDHVEKQSKIWKNPAA